MKARRAPAHALRLPPHRQRSGSLLFLAVATGLVLALILCTTAALHQQAHQLHTGAAHPRSLPSVDELYGDKAGRWPLSASAGPNQLLVLSYYNSQASLMARLLMLMGVYAGEPGQLHIDPSNRLRWWELQQLATLNDLVLKQHSTPGLPHRLARGFHVSKLSKQELDYYQDRLQGIVRYLSKHRPWLVKDPRMSWLASLWLERLEAPVCVLVVDMQPEQLAQHLSMQQQLSRQQQVASGGSGDEVEVSAATHVERWTNATLSSLKACFGVPTIIVPNTVLKPPLVQPFLEVLQQHLVAAGVQGTRLPEDELLQQQYLQQLQRGAPIESHCSHTLGNATISKAAGAALLQEACNWLSPKPHTGHSGLQEGTGTLSADASILPVPTQALLAALHEHLLASLAHPGTALQYSRVAGEVYTTYASRVKQMVTQSGSSSHHHSSHSDHHSIGALIVDALRHVETTMAAATLQGLDIASLQEA